MHKNRQTLHHLFNEAGVRAGAGEGMAKPMGISSARGAGLDPTPSGQLRTGQAGSACRNSPIFSQVFQKETIP